MTGYPSFSLSLSDAVFVTGFVNCVSAVKHLFVIVRLLTVATKRGATRDENGATGLVFFIYSFSFFITIYMFHFSAGRHAATSPF